jgi:hypothetical protein
MTMDLVDHMLVRVGDYTSDIEHYSTLRRRIRREFGGPGRVQLFNMLEEVIDGHLHMANFKLWASVGVDVENHPLMSVALDRVNQDLFLKGREICGNNMISGILLHAAVLEYVGQCENLFNELTEMVYETARAM